MPTNPATDEGLVEDLREMAVAVRKTRWIEQPLYGEKLETAATRITEMADEIRVYREGLERIATGAHPHVPSAFAQGVLDDARQALNHGASDDAA